MAKRKKMRKVDKEIMWVIGFMIALIVIFLIANVLFKGMNSFEYQGLSFTKERFGELPVYHYYYFFEESGEVYKYNLYLRNDPRGLEDIGVDGEIVAVRDNKVIISGDQIGLGECGNFTLATASLTSFFSNNLFEVSGGTMNEFYAAKSGLPYVTCDSQPDRLKVLLQKGPESSIRKVSKLCYEINVNNCEVLDAVEKFQLQTIVDAKDRLN